MSKMMERRMAKGNPNMNTPWREKASLTAPPVGEASSAHAEPKAAAAGSDQFVTDRDEQGQPKAPEKLEVPRVAAKKKEKAAEEPLPAAPVPPAPAVPEAAAPVATPAPAAPMSGGDSLDSLFESLPSEFIAKLINDLVDVDGLKTNKAIPAAVERLAAILKNRPVEAAEGVEGAAPVAPAPVAAPVASLTIDRKVFGGLQVVAGDEAEPVMAPKKVAAPKKSAAEEMVKKMAGVATTLSEIAAQFAKHSSGNGGSWFVSDQDTMEVTDNGGRTPEIEEAHGMRDDNTGIKRPETTAPIKLAADMGVNKAVKEAERLGQTLKSMYLDAKPICEVNNARPVREAVEAIFRAGDMFEEAVKTLNKQQMQEEAAAEAEKIREKGKKSSDLFGGLSVVGA